LHRTTHRHTAAVKRHVRSERIVLVVGFLLALSALLLFAWIAEEMLEGDTARFDLRVTTLVHARSTSQLTAAMKALTVLGSSLVMAPLALLTLLVCYFRRDFDALKTLATTFVGALLFELLLKPAFHRARPVPFFDLPVPASFSFPSGHALFSFCFFATLAALLSARVTRRATKFAYWFILLALSLGIGFSRIYLGVHYPSDVLAGYAAGVVWVSTVKFVNDMHHRNVKREWTAA
jgi:membrane-associated phospholipid phosphatase